MPGVRLNWLLLIVAALACLGAPPGRAQDRPVSNPMLLPKTILAERGDERDHTQFKLVFDRTRNGAPAGKLSVLIGFDYFAVLDGNRMTISDMRLLRRFVVDNAAETLVNLSLYSDVMFRRVELIRRMEIASELEHQKDHPVLPESLDRFWIESELGIAGPGKLAAPIEPRQEGDTTLFYYGEQKVASVKASDTEVPAPVRHAYAAFLRRTLPVHPVITTWLGKTATAPKQLDFLSQATGKEEKITLTLTSATSESADFPMPEHLTLVLLPQGSNDPDVLLMRQVLPRMTEAVTTHGVDRAAQIGEFRAAIDRDFKENHPFAAALRLTELALRWGRSATECEEGKGEGPCWNKDEIDKKLRADPRSVTMFKATAMQDRKPAEALKLWSELDRGDAPNGYVVDIFLGRLLSERGQRQAAAKAFAAAFAGDPFIVALYRELGDHYARASRLDLAWLCYDLGRALPDRAPPDALTGIDTIEQELVKTYPDMF